MRKHLHCMVLIVSVVYNQLSGSSEYEYEYEYECVDSYRRLVIDDVYAYIRSTKYGRNMEYGISCILE